MVRGWRDEPGTYFVVATVDIVFGSCRVRDMDTNCKDEIEVREEQVTARVSSDLLDRLREVARQNDRPLAAEIRVAIRAYLRAQ